MMDEIIDPRDPRKRAPSVGSSPVGCSPRFADTALRICFGNAVGFSKGKKFDSLHGHRIDPIARLPLDIRKVLPLDNWPPGSRRPDDSEHAAGGVVLLSGAPRGGSIHWLLSEDGFGRDISSSDVFPRLSRTSCVGSKARGPWRVRWTNQSVPAAKIIPNSL